jgi:hypothetical protein
MKMISLLNQMHTSNAAIVTTLCGDGISLSILRYRSTSAIASLSKLASSAFGSVGASVGNNSPRSGGTVDTVAHAKAEIMVHM